MTATVGQAAIDLMPQLRDILQLPEDLDLPRLSNIKMTAYQDDPGWTVKAMLWLGQSLSHQDDLARWEALQAWAPGVVPALSEPSVSSLTPSGLYRKASVTITVAEVSVEIWTHVDATFAPPQDAEVAS